MRIKWHLCKQLPYYFSTGLPKRYATIRSPLARVMVLLPAFFSPHKGLLEVLLEHIMVAHLERTAQMADERSIRPSYCVSWLFR